MSDEDAKFLAALREAQEAQERQLKAANEDELQAFKARHEQLTREAVRKAEEEARREALLAAKSIKAGKVATTKAAMKVAKPATTTSKRAALGIKKK